MDDVNIKAAANAEQDSALWRYSLNVQPKSLLIKVNNDDVYYRCSFAFDQPELKQICEFVADIV